MRPHRAFYAWWAADSGALPSAAKTPWTKVGPESPLLYPGRGLRMNNVSVVAPLIYRVEAPAGHLRENLYFQASVQGVSNTPGWASGASSVGLMIGNGQRTFLLSIGSTLRLVDATTGAIAWTFDGQNPWTRPTVYRFRLEETSAWKVEVDGKPIGEVPFALASADVSAAITFAFGCFDTTGTADAYFDAVEAGQYMAVPRDWLVRKLFSADFPVRAQEVWTPEARGLLRATAGVYEDVFERMEGARNEHTSRSLPMTTYTFSGKALPNAETPAWTLVNAPGFSVTRERVRITSNTVNLTSAQAAPSGLTIPTSAEFLLRSDVLVQSYTADAFGRVGPMLVVDNGHRKVAASLIETGGSARAWVLTRTADNAPVVELGRRWTATPYREQAVEVRLLGHAWALLLVDGKIVDRLAYTDIVDVGAAPTGTILSARGTAAVQDFQRATFQVNLHDLSRRPGLLQRTIERIIPLAGCERNDEVELWKRHCHDVHAMRGTTRMLEVELERLSCGQFAAVVADESPASWFLEVTYPEVTPIYLELDGYLYDVYAEFSEGAPNWDPGDLAVWIARYMLPRSVTELTYYACLVTETTNVPVLVGGKHRIAVTSSEHFSPGDTVTLRNAANTVKDDTVVSTIVSPLLIDVDLLGVAPGLFPAGSVLRKVLVTS